MHLSYFMALTLGEMHTAVIPSHLWNTHKHLFCSFSSSRFDANFVWLLGFEWLIQIKQNKVVEAWWKNNQSRQKYTRSSDNQEGWAATLFLLSGLSQIQLCLQRFLPQMDKIKFCHFECKNIYSSLSFQSWVKETIRVVQNLFPNVRTDQTQ